MEHKIKASSMLQEINAYAIDNNLREFSLTYITSEGKRVKRSRMVKSGGGPSKYSKPDNRSFYNVKEKGVMHLYNQELRRTETPIIALITHYNGLRVWH